MGNGIVELAKMLKERENAASYSPVFGRVIQLPSVKIAVGNKIILTSEDLKMCVELTESDIGKEVILLPYANYQKYILIGVVR